MGRWRYDSTITKSAHQTIFLLSIGLLISTASHSAEMNCSGDPCMYGICLQDNSTYSCYCIDGYTGIHCEINWDDCWSSPCLNGGTCNDAVASFNCTCPEGFVGANCEQKYSECANQPCFNNGTCLDYDGVICQCPDGYSGDYCEIDASVCNDTICKNGGECVEGPGFSFYCRCAAGWTGSVCDTDVDECLNSPCKNGGLCINVPASYTCACLFGFTGKDCDKAIVPCTENPCENSAVCLLEDEYPVCYCVPDYHGVLCELKYDDCESKFANCENGGTCIDGINSYTCACPPHYSGEICLDYEFPATTSFGPEGTTEVDVTGSKAGTTLGFSHSPSHRTSSIPQTVSTLVNTTVSPIIITSSSSRSYTRWYPSSEVTFPTQLELNGTLPPEDSITVSLPTVEESSRSSDSRETSATDAITVEPMVSSHFPSEMDSSLSIMDTETEASSTTYAFIEDAGTTTYYEGGAQSTLANDVTAEISNQTEYPITTVEEHPTSEKIDRSTVETSDVNIESTIAFSVSHTEENRASLDDKSTESTISYPGVTSSLLPPISTETEVKPSETSTFFTTFPGFVTITSQTFPSSRSETDIVVDQTSISKEPLTTPSIKDCQGISCATSSPTSAPRNVTECDCSDSKENCRTASSVTRAAFNGKSYARHRVLIDVSNDVNATLQIYLKLKTKYKNGIILHVYFDDERYALVYLHDSSLKFQFSCGLETMLLGEIDSPIDNGYEVAIDMIFQYFVKEDSDSCSAKLFVNDTTAVSGEQILSPRENIPRHANLHLGGIPVTFSHYFPHVAMGFIGCMSLFKVNGISKHFIHDSTETFQIEECTSFLCLSNPCQNFGVCAETNGMIRCKCIAGYTGQFCERSACEDNPCSLGATCISSPGTGFVCVCPLGTHGLLCEEDTVVIRPSFSVIVPGFSSYVAYGVPTSVKDTMELKMRIIPRTLEQISLLAYLGQSGPRRDLSDHFSITYVHGYIMLTWDLGSGVRRIFTTTPLTAVTTLTATLGKSYKPHILRVGRRGKDAWLAIDGVENVTGRAVGSMTQLDVSPILYIGGHKTRNFETLPHDLPLHTGFSGCIFDIELRTEGSLYSITSSSPITGRGVGECHHNECIRHSCKNGAVCLNHGPTYSCVCTRDWIGPDCSIPMENSPTSLC